MCPVWGSEFTSKDAALRGVGEIAARLNVKLCVLVVVVVESYPFSRPILYTEIKIRHGNYKPTDLRSSEMVLFLREAMRAIASLGCEV